MMSLRDEDLFKPLSAKVGRKSYSCGGNEMTAARVKMSVAKSAQMAVARVRKAKLRAVSK